ncbi:ATP-binding protein [Pseudobacteriovorax antillogorgiicola]|uniref:histidine kinase n=1 Tax=Pseudobacteriovorax antillogorgiicola TaxID=1513793 RepID=A0A1Y6BRM0_9BACT|nr:ATP-binding protein [Pseudobacteriovorax antillogorgiicola]TCS54618.1 cyclic nucleotide-binding protein [Pseudobacteriovorax antillogorgiicola]SMF17414.1 signal transduction histidine kinase [Pseudobacteriovorax antillogorgiicola]
MTHRKTIQISLLSKSQNLSDLVQSEIHDLFGTQIELNIISERPVVEDNELLQPIFLADGQLGKKALLDFFAKSPDPSFKVLLAQESDFSLIKDMMNTDLDIRLIAVPWEQADFYRTVKDLLSDYFLHHAFDQVEYYENLVSHRRYRQALYDKETERASLAKNFEELKGSLIAPQKHSNQELTASLRESMNRLKLEPTLSTLIVQHPAGTQICQEGKPLDILCVILSGTVSHRKRDHDLSETEVMREGPGSILGSMAHFLGNKAYTSIFAEEDLELLQLNSETLELILNHSQEFTVQFINILLRQISGRVRLHVETNLQLQKALADLKAIQIKLVDTEKMATLGQLVAGIAHELNNPVAAIMSSIPQLGECLESIVNSNGHEGDFRWRAFEQGYQLASLSSRDLRQRRRDLEKMGLPESAATEFAEMSFHDRDILKAILKEFETYQKATGILQSYFQTGRFLKTIASSSQRLDNLVRSLRNYAKPGKREREPVDIHQGIEETLLMLQHRIKLVSVVKDYGTLSPVMGYPSKLNQVWTNIINNALDAMESQDTQNIRISTVAKENYVEVAFHDNGIGMSDVQLEKAFDLYFSTKKQGQVGMGLGLPICKSIVMEHGGDIRIASKVHQGTTVTVRIPTIGGRL